MKLLGWKVYRTQTRADKKRKRKTAQMAGGTEKNRNLPKFSQEVASANLVSTEAEADSHKARLARTGPESDFLGATRVCPLPRPKSGKKILKYTYRTNGFKIL